MIEVSDILGRDVNTGLVTIYRRAGGYERGVYKETFENLATYSACVQPTSNKERMALERGGQRIVDPKTIYIGGSSAKNFKLAPADLFKIDGLEGFYVSVQTDSRPAQSYHKIIVNLVDSEKFEELGLDALEEVS